MISRGALLGAASLRSGSAIGLTSRPGSRWHAEASKTAPATATAKRFRIWIISFRSLAAPCAQNVSETDWRRPAETDLINARWRSDFGLEVETRRIVLLGQALELETDGEPRTGEWPFWG